MRLEPHIVISLSDAYKGNSHPDLSKTPVYSHLVQYQSHFRGPEYSLEALQLQSSFILHSAKYKLINLTYR